MPQHFNDDSIRAERILLDMVRPDPIQPRRVLPEKIHLAFHENRLTPSQALREMVQVAQVAARQRGRPISNLLELLPDAEREDEADVKFTPEYERLELLILSELFVFGRHTVTQLLMSLGLNEEDWSAWYRLFSEERFKYEKTSEGLFRESLPYVKADETMHGNRKYGERAPSPQQIWQTNKRWQHIDIAVRGQTRHLDVCVRGVFVRKGASDTPLFLIVVRGKQRKNKYGRSFATLLRSFRASLWGQHHFRPILTTTPDDWVRKKDFIDALKNTVYASMRT